MSLEKSHTTFPILNTHFGKLELLVWGALSFCCPALLISYSLTLPCDHRNYGRSVRSVDIRSVLLDAPRKNSVAPDLRKTCHEVASPKANLREQAIPGSIGIFLPYPHLNPTPFQYGMWVRNRNLLTFAF